MAVLTASGRSSDLDLGEAKPGVLLVVGVNGGGKTTTVGKLAHKLGREGAQARASSRAHAERAPAAKMHFSCLACQAMCLGQELALHIGLHGV